MATTYYENIQKLYVAYFNRPADVAGLAYWEGVVETANGNTASVSAAFANEAEYKTAFAGMSNADIVNKVYTNLFGRTADAAGRDYWANLLDKKQITIDQVVTKIAEGAQTTDLTAYTNKVRAATAFTAALDTTSEANGYRGDAANAIAKTFLSGVTTDATLAAAVSTTTLNATVASAVAAGTPFTLMSGLDALNIANQAKLDFLAAADGDNNAKTSITEEAIAAKVDTSIAGIAAQVSGDYTNASAGVRAALLADQVTANNTQLTNDQKALTDANTAIAKVAGLSSAMATLTASTTAVTNAGTVQKAAMVDLAAKLAGYNAQNGTTVVVNANGTVDGLIEVNATTKALQLVSGVTEANHAGVTALLAASTTMETADAAVTSATNAQVAAQTAVDRLDLTAAAQADLKDVAAAMTVIKLPAGTTPTQAQITTELTQLDAVRKSTADVVTNAGDAATDAQKTAAANALNSYNKFNDLVNKMIADDTANPLVEAQVNATNAVKADNDTIANLTKAVAALDAANATVAQLASVNGQVKAAQDAFTSHDMLLPVDLKAGGTYVATAGADIYTVGKVDASILNFGLLGSDSLYVGTQYTANTGTLANGNPNVLEAFIAQNGSDTTIKLEKTVFGSNAVSPEVITITLTGVDATKVHMTNGIITVA
jgi:hypothetical protein